MARALLESGYFPDRLYGSSAGALNAAAIAAGPSLATVSALEALWKSARRQDVFPLRPWSIAAGILGLSDHLVPSANLRRWLGRTCTLVRLEDGAVPLVIVTTDIQTGEMVLLDEGPAVTALMASSAMPGIFPPVRWQGRWLMDGSVASDTPVGPAVRDGASRVFVLPSVPAVKLAKPRTALEMLLASSAAALARSHDAAVREWSGHCELYVVPAPLVSGASPFNFSRTEQLLEQGYRVATEWLEHARPVQPPM